MSPFIMTPIASLTTLLQEVFSRNMKKSPIPEGNPLKGNINPKENPMSESPSSSVVAGSPFLLKESALPRGLALEKLSARIPGEMEHFDPTWGEVLETLFPILTRWRGKRYASTK